MKNLVISRISVILCISLSIIVSLWGCSKSRDKITAPPDELPSVKEPLLEYHPLEYLDTEIQSAPVLSQTNHSHGWKQADCVRCHRAPSKKITSDVCVNCHGKNGIEEDNCRNCHKVQSESGDPASGNHQAHVAKGPGDTGCVECHPGSPEKSKVHANGIVNVNISNGGKYNSITEDNGVIGECRNIVCHKDIRTWGGDCSSCHYNPPDTGYHEKHLEQKNLSCQDCHLKNQHDSDNNSGSIEVGNIEYNPVTGDCNSKCHTKTHKWKCTGCHDYPPPSGNHTVDSHQVGCEECHGNHAHSYKSATRPLDFEGTEVRFERAGSYRDDTKLCSGVVCHEDERVWGSSCSDCHSSPPETGTHRLHVENEKLKCQDCHSGNQHDLDAESGSIELGGISYNPITGDCTSTCHAMRKWGCTSCHSSPPDSGNHLAHNRDCAQCHQTHQHSYKAAVQPKDFSATQVDITGGGEFNPNNGLCSGTVCHESRSWGENCAKCHRNPPETGTHLSHVKGQKLSCQNCHKNNQHDLNVGSGSIELGGIGYNPITGDCTSTCHEARRWSCSGCHGYPPESGNHPAHESDCEQCHQQHQHSYKSAMAPKDFTPIQTDFAAGGNFDPNNKLCGNIGCHLDPRIWGSTCTECHGKPPTTGTHLLHVERENLKCQDCHKGYQHDLDDRSGSIEVGGVTYDSLKGDCRSTCHEERKWGCVGCHGYPPNTGTHTSHNKPSGKFFSVDGNTPNPIPCAGCHLDHQHSYKAAVAPREFSQIQVKFAQGGVFNSSNGLCNSVACHEPMKWGGSCGDCHGAPPETGLHRVHIASRLNCTQCHKGNQHDLDVSRGVIEIGDVDYEAFTGGCKSSCHGTRQFWDCTSCHGYPPETGQHKVHTNLSQFGCQICHKEHKHAIKSAIAPKDLRDVTVSFTIKGDWDKNTKTCENIGCHDNKQW